MRAISSLSSLLFTHSSPPPLFPVAWHGSLLEGKQDKTGTLYRRNRSYDPLAGRFTQEDPIGLAGGVNLYGFAAGDPVNFSDPFGLNPFCPTCRLVFAGARGGAIVGGSVAGIPGALVGAILAGTATGVLANSLLSENAAEDASSTGAGSLEDFIQDADGEARSNGDIAVQGGRERAKDLFNRNAGTSEREVVRDATGGGRGVAGKLPDGTPIRIRFKPDGSTRIQVGPQKFIFPK